MADIFKYGILYRTYDFIQSYREYRKVRRAVKDVFYSNDFKMVVKRYLNLDLDEDWLGRLYGVINPNVDIDGNFNVNNVIIEIDGNNTNTDEYVKTWLYRQLSLMGQLFNMKNLYSNINMEMEHVGPIDQDNYLVIFEIANRPEMAESFKKLMRTTIAYMGIAATALCSLFALHII